MELLLHWLARTLAPDYSKPWKSNVPEWEVEFRYEIRPDGALNESCSIPLWNHLYDGGWVDTLVHATTLPFSENVTREQVDEVVAAAKGGLVYIWISEQTPRWTRGSGDSMEQLDFALTSPRDFADLLPIGAPLGDNAYRIWVGPTDEGIALFEDPSTWVNTLLGDEPDPASAPIWTRVRHVVPFANPPWSGVAELGED